VGNRSDLVEIDTGHVHMSSRALFSDALTRATDHLDLALEDGQVQTLLAHYESVVEANRQFNLTRATEPADAAVKLYADSLAPLAWPSLNDATLCPHLATGGKSRARVLDVGTGAGFPAVPLAVARPDWRITAIDSTRKKTRFVARCADKLGLDNITTAHARAGDWRAPTNYDLALFKAVGTLERCLLFARGLVAGGGLVMCYKGPGLSPEELDAAQTPANRAGLQIWDTFDYELPWHDETLAYTLVIYRRA
jgi:16S rRNA (guanine527-N7)-methyltransferase